MEDQTQAKVCNNCQNILTEKGQMTEVTPHYQEISDGWEQKDPPSIRKWGEKQSFIGMHMPNHLQIAMPLLCRGGVGGLLRTLANRAKHNN